MGHTTSVTRIHPVRGEPLSEGAFAPFGQVRAFICDGTAGVNHPGRDLGVVVEVQL